MKSLRKLSKFSFFSLLFAVCFGTSAIASTIVVTFPEVNYEGGPEYPTGPINIGTDSFVLPPSSTIVSAVFSGTFGLTSIYSGSSAEAQLLLNGTQFLDSTTLTPDPYENIVPFSVTLSDTILSSLDSGSAQLDFIQTTGYVVRLSGTTLTLETGPSSPSSVPDGGSSVALLGGVMIGLAALRRRFLS